MKNAKNIFAMILAVVTCVGAMTACSSPSTGTPNESTGSTTPATKPSDSTQTTETILGLVTGVTSEKLTVNKYTAEGKVTDFAALDITKLTKTDKTEEIAINKETKYSVAEKGALKNATAEALVPGAMVALTKDNKGAQQIVVLAAPTKAEADQLGKVTFVGSDFLLMTLYTSAEKITDYTKLDTATLTAGETVVYVYLNGEVKYQQVSEGSLADAAATDVKADTLIAAATGEDGKLQVIILPAPAESTPE